MSQSQDRTALKIRRARQRSIDQIKCFHECVSGRVAVHIRACGYGGEQWDRLSVDLEPDHVYAQSQSPVSKPSLNAQSWRSLTGSREEAPPSPPIEGLFEGPAACITEKIF